MRPRPEELWVAFDSEGNYLGVDTALGKFIERINRFNREYEVVLYRRDRVVRPMAEPRKRYGRKKTLRES